MPNIVNYAYIDIGQKAVISLTSLKSHIARNHAFVKYQTPNRTYPRQDLDQVFQATHC